MGVVVGVGVVAAVLAILLPPPLRDVTVSRVDDSATSAAFFANALTNTPLSRYQTPQATPFTP